MLSQLVIIDASACVYTGMTSPKHRDRTYYKYAVGGLHYLFRYITTNLARKNDIIVAFDSRSFRNDLIDGYKAGRSHDKRVHSQLELAYKYLTSSNIACYKYDGYEADDIIYWAVQQNVGKYYEIEIYGNDKDLLHNIQDTVSFKSIRADMNSVYMINYEKSIEKGKTIRFNTISAYKVFCGCKSDKIPSLSLQCGLRGEQIYKKYLEFLDKEKIPSIYKVITNSKLVNLFASLSGLFTKDEQLEVYNRVNLIYPATCPSGIEVVGKGINAVNKDVFNWTLSLFNDYESIFCMKYNKIALSNDDIALLKDYSNQILTGAYEVDRNQRCEYSYLDAFDEENLFLRDV